MARGLTLGDLVTKTRIAARYDANPALSQNMVPLIQQTISDVQERLYDEFDWPFLKVVRTKQLAPGQRYYDFPEDLNLERVTSVEVRYGGLWLPLHRGISNDELNNCDSDNDQRRDPVARWDVSYTGPVEQMEVWPLPATFYELRITGIRKLKPLVQASDMADLDDQLIVCYAAGELLGGAKNELAQAKFAQGKKRLETLRGRVSKRTRSGFRLGGGADDCDNPRGYPRGPGIVSVQG